jgi:hypothetical protein
MPIYSIELPNGQIIELALETLKQVAVDQTIIGKIVSETIAISRNAVAVAGIASNAAGAVFPAKPAALSVGL